MAKNDELEIAVVLVFDDWQRDGRSVYATEAGVELSSGDLHSGTVIWKGVIRLPRETVNTIDDARRQGISPIFRLVVE